ncbi:MAG: SRPBCC family protein [Rhodospirillales bacterium]|nr:SRPBCC family protein [Rhodospirillales bacterium]
MAKISMSTQLNVSADEAWKMIGGFNTLPDWHPAVEASELTEEGQTRTLSLVGGGEIVEKLEKSDEAARTYTYSIVNSPLPLANYTSTIVVRDGDDGCVVDWSGEFDALGGGSEASDIVSGIYQTGLDNLKKMFGG